MASLADRRNASSETIRRARARSPERLERHGARRAARSPTWMPPALRGYSRAWLSGDIVAGITLAAVAIPECMGYTKIVGTPVVTGLYTILLPIAAFGLLGSSRHLVVGADSATAAILFAGLAGMADPFSARWLALTSAAALVTGGFLVVAGALRLGFLADFLSRTVLVGFLSGVGVSLIVGEIPDMLGIAVQGRGFFSRIAAIASGMRGTHLPTLAMAVAVLAVIVAFEHLAPKVPGALVALALAIAAAWTLRLDRIGIGIVGAVQPGFPALQIPALSAAAVVRLLATCASMFLVIVAQSAATARSFAEKHGEHVDENRDLFALAAANVVAGLSSTFVVNGSPTKTAIAEASGARTQLAQLTTALVVLVVLLFATPLIEHLPVAALAALVFLIGVTLVDVESLRDIYVFRKTTFAVALGTLCAVVLLGVERGIFVAIALSVLDHVRQEYRPKDVVLTSANSRWKPTNANPGVETEPGLIVYRFEAPLFFANADHFSARVHDLVAEAPHAVEWFLFDFVSMDDVDYTGGLALTTKIEQLQRQGTVVALANVDDVRDTLRRLGIVARVGEAYLFDTVQEAIDAFHRRRAPA